MRMRATRYNNPPSSGAHIRPSSRPFPVQAKRDGAHPGQEEASAEQVTAKENPSYRGANFGQLRVFPGQPSPSGSGEPLPESLQQEMEAAFHASFSDVRVHQGPAADSLSALAFTQGRDIHFAPGRYNPSSLEGQKIIAHELTHVVQQRQGRVAMPQGKGAPVNANSALEAEADTLGAKAARGESINVFANASERRSGEVKGYRAGPNAPIQGMMRRFLGGGGPKYQQVRDEDEEAAKEDARARKKLDKSLEGQTKDNIAKHHSNLHPGTSAVSNVANKVGTGASYVGKGVTFLSGGTDLGIGTAVGSGVKAATKGGAKAVEMVQRRRDYQDPKTRSEAEPLRPKLNSSSDLESAVEIGGTVAKGLVTVAGEASEFLGGPPLPTSTINKGISAATTVGSQAAKQVDKSRNEENMSTADEYAELRQRLEEEENG